MFKFLFNSIFLSITILLFSGCSLKKPEVTIFSEFIIKSSSSDVNSSTSKIIHNNLKTTPSNIVIIYDASGSMKKKIENIGIEKYKIAFDALNSTVNLFKKDESISLLVFGSKKPFGLLNSGEIYKNNFKRAYESHEDIELVYSSKKGFIKEDFLNSTKYLSKSSSYIGDTPIGYSILKAVSILEMVSKKFPNRVNKIILLGDGIETGTILKSKIDKLQKSEKEKIESLPNYSQVVISAEDSIDEAVKNKIKFVPILYGLNWGKDSKELKDFYENLAIKSGSIYLASSNLDETIKAFIDADLTSKKFELHSSNGLIIPGSLNNFMKIPIGKYKLKMETNSSIYEKELEIIENKKNVYSFKINKSGKLELTNDTK